MIRTPWIPLMASFVASAQHLVDAAFVHRDGFVDTRPDLQATSRGTRPDRHLPDEVMVSIERRVSETTNNSPHLRRLLLSSANHFSFRSPSIPPQQTRPYREPVNSPDSSALLNDHCLTETTSYRPDPASSPYHHRR